MLISKKIFSTIILLFSFFVVFPQSTVWLIDGTVLTTNKCEFGDKEYIECFTEKGKIKHTDTADVFALIKGTDTTFIYENPNYPLEKAKIFMEGQIAGKKYNNYYVYTGGFVMGAIAPYSLIFTPIPAFLAPVVSVGYTASFSHVNPKSKFCDIPDKYADNEDYVAGYQLSATRKKIKNTAIFSAIGLVTGYAILFLVKP